MCHHDIFHQIAFFWPSYIFHLLFFVMVMIFIRFTASKKTNNKIGKTVFSLCGRKCVKRTKITFKMQSNPENKTQNQYLNKKIIVQFLWFFFHFILFTVYAFFYLLNLYNYNYPYFFVFLCCRFRSVLQFFSYSNSKTLLIFFCLFFFVDWIKLF